MADNELTVEEIDELQIEVVGLDLPNGKFNHVCDMARRYATEMPEKDTRIAELEAQVERMRRGLEDIAQGEGVYGAQAYEYKKIAIDTLATLADLPDTSKAVEKINRRALRDVAAERNRQIEQEGWSLEHDDEHSDRELTRAAACYALGRSDFWPWDAESWNPSDQRRDLIKAAALIVAEIERLDRAAEHGIQSTGDE